MNKNNQIDMMRRCSEEIQMLRNTISVLQPKAEAYETIVQILALLPRHSQGQSIDIVWVLKKEIASLEAETTEVE